MGISLRDFSRKITELFARSGLDEPRVETRFFLREMTGLELEEQLARADLPLAEEMEADLWLKAKRRAAREPLAYISGEAWFYGRSFLVKANLLVPRPDSEVLVEAALEEIEEMVPDVSAAVKAQVLEVQEAKNQGAAQELIDMILREVPTTPDNKPLSILDSCCGTGCLGLSLLAELRDMDIAAGLHLVDLDDLALQTAKENAARLDLLDKVSLEKSDLWPARIDADVSAGTRLGVRAEPIRSPESDCKYDIILCNPPYIPGRDIFALMPEVAMWESKRALDGGPDGLDFYRRLADNCKDYLAGSGVMILELGAGQAEQVISLFQPAEQARIRLKKDYNGVQRALILKGHT